VENFRVLRAGINEVSNVAKLFDLYRQFYQQKPDIILAEKYIRDRVAKQQSIIYAAVDKKDEMFGFCQIYPTFCSVIAAPMYVLYDLFVLQTKRKMGVGRALLVAAEDNARASGVSRMELSTARSNIGAQLLYQSLGWEQDEVFLTYVRTITT